jgi:predicted O-methyltransferase YrrM
MPFSEDFENYYQSLINSQPLETDQLYTIQQKRNRPIIKRDGAIMLQQYILSKDPDRVLEIGTNGGFSAITMAKVMRSDAKLHTIDFRWDHLHIARKNFQRYGVSDKIITHHGYGLDVIKNLDQTFDIIFIDADKGNYMEYLKESVKLLNSKGIILVDNLLWKSSVFSRSDQPLSATETLREFNQAFVELEGFKSIILPVGDGLGVAVKES